MCQTLQLLFLFLTSLHKMMLSWRGENSMKLDITMEKEAIIRRVHLKYKNCFFFSSQLWNLQQYDPQIPPEKKRQIGEGEKARVSLGLNLHN